MKQTKHMLECEILKRCHILSIITNVVSTEPIFPVYAKTTGSVYKSMETRIYTGLMEGNDIHTAPMATKY